MAITRQGGSDRPLPPPISPPPPHRARSPQVEGLPEQRIPKRLGSLPIMLKSRACYLRNLSRRELVARKVRRGCVRALRARAWSSRGGGAGASVVEGRALAPLLPSHFHAACTACFAGGEQ